MGRASETFFVLLAAGASLGAPEVSRQPQRVPSPLPSASVSPSPPLRYKLIPYAFETAQERSAVPLLRFEDQTEVRSLEMNDAIARFFPKGDMLRGATPGGAPSLRDMVPYRPHVTAGMDFLGVAALAAKQIRQTMQNRRGMPAASPTPSPTPSP